MTTNEQLQVAINAICTVLAQHPIPQSEYDRLDAALREIQKAQLALREEIQDGS